MGNGKFLVPYLNLPNYFLEIKFWNKRNYYFLINLTWIRTKCYLKFFLHLKKKTINLIYLFPKISKNRVSLIKRKVILPTSCVNENIYSITKKYVLLLCKQSKEFDLQILPNWIYMVFPLLYNDFYSRIFSTFLIIEWKGCYIYNNLFSILFSHQSEESFKNLKSNLPQALYKIYLILMLKSYFKIVNLLSKKRYIKR